MNKICVVYLARAANGIEPVRLFLDSYQKNESGIDHDFLVLFKGFKVQSDKNEYIELLKPFQYLSFDVPDIGFDITAYFSATKHHANQYQYFCFLNTFSIILSRDWLSKLYNQISLPNVGMAGATGSWQSLNPWGQIFKRRRMNLRFTSNVEAKVPGLWERINFKLDIVRRLFFVPLFFSRYPNGHLRTNAFIISGDSMMKVKLPVINTKFDAYKFESGKSGLTNQIIDMGKEVLVVGNDGVGYKTKLWNKSKIFWQSEQENLLVADNQTRVYQNGTPEQRRYLTVMAWGEVS
jgi:hypothetical protein